MFGKKIIVIRRGNESKIFFRPWEYHLPKEELNNKLEAYQFEKKFSYFDDSRLCKGEILLCFNPLEHTRSARHWIEKEIITYIKTHN